MLDSGSLRPVKTTVDRQSVRAVAESLGIDPMTAGPEESALVLSLAGQTLAEGGADDFFPYQIANLTVGPITAMVATVEAVASFPTKLQDVLQTYSPYTAVSPFFRFGAGVNPGSYSTGNTQSDLTIEQDTEPVDTEVTAVNRSIQINMAEFSPQALAIVEQSPGVELVAAQAGVAVAQDAVPFGSYSDLDHYRVVLLARRKKKWGIVTEPGGATRGRILGAFLYSATITGDAKTAQFAKGSLASMDITFQAYPDAAAPGGSDHGRWLSERAGAI
jgi:hypothetical protein